MRASLAMLLKDERPSTPVTGPALADRLIQDWPDLDASRLTVSGEQDPGDAILDYGGTGIVVSTADTPLDLDIERVAAHSGQWPLTFGAPTDCTAYAAVAVTEPDGPDSHEEAIARAVLLSRALVSLLNLDESFRAVYWGAANHLVHPAAFLDQAKVLPKPMLPAWTAISVGPRADGSMSGYTRGLDMLGLQDLELPSVDESEDETFERLAGITMYQLEAGPVLGDGETIAGPRGDVMLIQHTESADGEGRQVVRLTPQKRKRGLFGRRK